MLRQQHRFFRSVLVAADLVLVVGAGVAAYGLRFHALVDVSPPVWEAVTPAYTTHAIPMEVAVPIMMLALMWVGQYRPRRDERFFLEAAAIVKGVAVGVGATIVIVSMFQNILFGGRHYSGLQFILYGACAVMMLMAWRFCFRIALRRLRARGFNLRHVAIIGTGRLGQQVFHTLKRNTWTGITPVFFVSHRKYETRTTCLGLPVSGLADLESTFEAAQITGVFIAVPGRRSALIPTLITRLRGFPLDVRVVPDVNPRYVPMNMSAGELDGLAVLSIRESPFNGWGGVLKRSVDMVGGVLLTGLFAVPMMTIGVLIHLYGGAGPVLYRQQRMGLNGREFRIFKFRTMSYADTDRLDVHSDGQGRDVRTRPDTGRITGIGRFLRRTSLDELPQLLNVIVGDMSLVGPRPMAELISGIRDEWDGCMLRQNVKPGITGWAQVNGLRGQTSLRKRLQYDLFYIRNWSIMFDMRILWMTIFRGFANPHAN